MSAWYASPGIFVVDAVTWDGTWSFFSNSDELLDALYVTYPFMHHLKRKRVK